MKTIDTSFLSRYIKNPELIQVIDKILNNPCVYVIKNEYYAETPFTERVYLTKTEKVTKERYRKINVPKVMQKMPSRVGAKDTLLQHSRRVLETASDIAGNIKDMYLALDTITYKTYWERDSLTRDLQDIYYAGAILHDIGKALTGITGIDLDRHALVGASYLHCYMAEIRACFLWEINTGALYRKLENIIENHMLFVLDKKYKEDITDRYPKKSKDLETYLISLADWHVNTQDREFERESIDLILEDLARGFRSHAYRPIVHGETVCIRVNNFELTVMQGMRGVTPWQPNTGVRYTWMNTYTHTSMTEDYTMPCMKF